MHEPAGTDIRTNTGEYRTRPMRGQRAAESTACDRSSGSRAITPVATHVCDSQPDLWRFAAEWRTKPADNFISTAAQKRFFRCLNAGIASLIIFCAVGCKTSESRNSQAFSSSPSSSPFAEDATLKPVSPQMITVTNQLDPSLLRAPTNLFTLGPGDKLDIELADETNSLSTTVVGPDGKIYFNLLPGTDVWGLTLEQTQQLLEQEMRKYVRGRPLVNVTLRDVESKHVWLLGRFQQPGIYNMAAPTTLLEAIAAAGGPQSFAGQRQISEGGPLGEDLADLQRSFIVRDNKMLPVDFYRLVDKGDISQNIYLKPDDFVYFAPAYAKEVYVLGAVTQPKPVQYVEGMTLMQAIAGAYGTVRDAWLAHVTIIRGSLSDPQCAFVNYYDVVKGKAPDVILQPNDIVYVPLTRYRYLRKYIDIALNTFVSSVAINAGTKLSQPPNGVISGVIIPAGSGITITPPPAPPVGQ